MAFWFIQPIKDGLYKPKWLAPKVAHFPIRKGKPFSDDKHIKDVFII